MRNTVKKLLQLVILKNNFKNSENEEFKSPTWFNSIV